MRWKHKIFIFFKNIWVYKIPQVETYWFKLNVPKFDKNDGRVSLVIIEGTVLKNCENGTAPMVFVMALFWRSAFPCAVPAVAAPNNCDKVVVFNAPWESWAAAAAGSPKICDAWESLRFPTSGNVP